MGKIGVLLLGILSSTNIFAESYSVSDILNTEIKISRKMNSLLVVNQINSVFIVANTIHVMSKVIQKWLPKMARRTENS
jgi:hypothetical protein